MRLAPVLALVSLSACAPAVDTLPPLDAGSARPPAVAAAPDACGAAGLQVLVGKDVALFEAQARSGPSRILSPGQAATADFSAERVTVSVDAAGRITRAVCG